MRVLAFVLAAVLLGGCMDLVTRTQSTADIPRETPLSFESQTDISAVATANLEKSAQIYYEGTTARSAEADFVYQAAIRIAGILGINTQYDAGDPEQLKEILNRGTRALEEKNRQIDDLRRQVEDYQVMVTQATTEATTATNKAGLLSRWVRYLIVAGCLLVVIQIITGLPVFTGSLSLLKKVGQQTIAGVQEIREGLKKKALDGDAAARETLATIDATLNKHQDAAVRDEIKKLKG